MYLMENFFIPYKLEMSRNTHVNYEMDTLRIKKNKNKYNYIHDPPPTISPPFPANLEVKK